MRGGDYSVRVYVRWTDLGEEEVPLAAIAERLAEFDADTTLRLLCWVNQLVSFGESNEAEATYHLLGEDMTQRLWRHIQAHGTPAAALHRQQLLVAVRMALLHCSPSGSRRIENDDDRFLLGRLLLQINDHLGRSQQDTSLTSDLIDRPSDLSSALAATYLLSNHQQFEMYSVRYQKILFELVPQALAKGGFAADLWAAKYRTRYGADLEKVWCLGYQLVRLIDSKLAEIVNKSPTSFEVANGRAITRWSQEEYESVLDALAGDVEFFRRAYSEPSKLSFDVDFEPFRQKPFIRLGNDIVCIDRGMVLEFIGEQTLWRVREAFTPAEGRDAYGAVLGAAVEAYADWALRSAFPKPAAIGTEDRLRTPRTIEVKTGHTVKVPDFEVLNHPVGQLFECKGFLFTSRALFSDDGAALAHEMKTKLASERGVKQLSAYMAWRMRTPAPGDPKRYQAVLITLDRALSLPGVQSTLRRRAWQHFEEEWQAIDSVRAAIEPIPHRMFLRFLAIGLDEVEMLAAYVRGGAALTDLVDAMIEFDREGISAPKLGIDHARYRAIADWRFLLEANPPLEEMLSRNFRDSVDEAESHPKKRGVICGC